MKIRITAGGIYGVDGEVPIGSEFTVKDVPKGWAGRYEIVGGDAPKDAVAITNPTKAEGFTVIDKGRGWFVVAKDGEEVTKSLRADDVEGFNDMSADDKAAFVELNKAG